MNRQFLLILLGSLVVIGLGVFLTVNENQKTLLTLTGSVTDVQLKPLSDGATLALVDFEAKNPAEIGFEINQIEVEAHDGKEVIGGVLLSKSEAKVFLDYEKIELKNPQVGFGDEVKAGQTRRGVVVARINLPPARLMGAEFVVRFTNVNHISAEVKGRKR